MHFRAQAEAGQKNDENAEKKNWPTFSSGEMDYLKAQAEKSFLKKNKLLLNYTNV